MMNPIDETRILCSLADLVIKTANESYNLSFGWSEIVECWTRNEIFHELRKHAIYTEEKALEHFAFIAKVRSEYAEEIESTVW